MRLEQLSYIVAAADAASISKAARHLHVSQPCISQAILALEDELGINIFIRSRKGIFPTEQGEIVLERAREIISKVGELCFLEQDDGSKVTGKLFLGTIPTLNHSLLSRTLPHIKVRFPKLEIYISENSSDVLKEQVLDGEVDLALVGLPPLCPIDGQLEAISITKSSIMACVGKSSPLASRTSISLRELVQYPIISTSPTVIRELSRYGSPQHFFHCRNMEASKIAISEGFAIGFYTALALKFDPYIKYNLIVPLRIEEPLELAFYILRRRADTSSVNRCVLEELRNQFANIGKLLHSVEWPDSDKPQGVSGDDGGCLEQLKNQK